jgi:hypothetical protein
MVELVLPFDSDDPEFTRGFEAGRLWEQLSRDEAVEMAVHASNIEMVMRMGEAAGRIATGDDLADDWVLVRFH